MYTETNIHTAQRWTRDREATAVRLAALGYNAENFLNDLDAGNEIETEHAWFIALGRGQ